MTALVFLAVFAFYLAGASPAIAPRDAADMASAALTLGVAHPPGYPLYAVLGKAWLAVFTAGNPAYRLAVLSALAAAGAAALLFAFVRRRRGAWAGLAAAAVWAFSAPLWKFALIQEKYALHALFAAGLLFLSEGGRDDVWRRARLSGFLIGLGLVNHQSLLLWLPGLLWLWKTECGRHDAPLDRALSVAAPWLAAGLSLYGFLWVRLGGLGPALATASRAQYGSGTLFAGLARPLTAERAVGLFSWSLGAWARAVGLPAAAAAALGAAAAWREERGRAAGLLVGALAAGPLFVILSRFDPSSWIARSVLEPALLLPAMTAALFAGEACAYAGAGAAASALALAVAAQLARVPVPERREDFLAHDYAQNLRRAVPPAGALLAGGDTALFGLRWLDLTAPRIEGITAARDVAGIGLTDPRRWLDARSGRPDVFVTGVGLNDLTALGLGTRERPLSPEGLVQRVGRPAPARSSEFVVLRRPNSWERDDSYARDAKLSYAYASWVAARLMERQGARPPETLDLSAVSLDPEDYRLE
ncbi:MAG: DUF2723 domain-containing protein [Elusimicrobia bacterium]|nr:DUF2723 domain-containing protein [Elusimicrobiota bacterium]